MRSFFIRCLTVLSKLAATAFLHCDFEGFSADSFESLIGRLKDLNEAIEEVWCQVREIHGTIPSGVKALNVLGGASLL